MELLKSTTKVIKTNTFLTKYEDILIVETIVDDVSSISIKNELSREYGNIVLIDDNFLNFIKTNNPFAFIENELPSINKFSKEDIYDMIQSGSFLFMYYSGHMLFDCNKKPLPYAKSYDYISTILNNKYCDLDKLLIHLKEHEWVINKDDIKIEDIPYYNADDEQNQFIRVSIYPSVESYQDLYEVYKDSEYPSTKMDKFISSINDYTKYDPMGLLPFMK